MNRIKIQREEVIELLDLPSLKLPKYSSFIMNRANRWSQGTRPKVVGQMSELIKEFGDGTFEEWKEWYRRRKPNAIEKATQKISDMIDNFRVVLAKIDEDLIRRWVEDLVITKTFAGLKFQEAILKKVAQTKGVSYRKSNPKEESRGIDGFIGDEPVSVKPMSYKNEEELLEDIAGKIIYYEKDDNNNVVIEFNF